MTLQIQRKVKVPMKYSISSIQMETVMKTTNKELGPLSLTCLSVIIMRWEVDYTILAHRAQTRSRERIDQTTFETHQSLFIQISIDTHPEKVRGYGRWRTTKWMNITGRRRGRKLMIEWHTMEHRLLKLLNTGDGNYYVMRTNGLINAIHVGLCLQTYLIRYE